MGFSSVVLGLFFTWLDQLERVATYHLSVNGHKLHAQETEQPSYSHIARRPEKAAALKI